MLKCTFTQGCLWTKISYNFGLGNVTAVKMEEGCEPCQRPEHRSDVRLASFNLGQ